MNDEMTFLDLIITLGIISLLFWAFIAWISPSEECKEKYKEEIRQCVLNGGENCAIRVCDVMEEEEED